MDPPISSTEDIFSNLDIFCEWNGNPEEPVGVTINIDVRKPETQGSSFSLSIILTIVTGVGTPKPELADSQRPLCQCRQGSITIRLLEDRPTTEYH